MRDPKRIPKILSVLEKIWIKCPDLRLGQIIHNAHPSNSDLFYVEDDVMLEALERFLEAAVWVEGTENK